MKIFLKTFGCRVNQVESQAIREKFASQGADFVAKFEDADICVLNTCTVTASADKDVEKQVRQILSRAPKARLVLTGCYALAHKAKIEQNFPTAQVIEKHALAKTLFNDAEFFWTVEGHEGRTRAFVKIQDGCDNFCSYCIVPFARPAKTSKPMRVALAEIQKIIDNNFKEIVLTGINIGNYLCPETGAKLDGLLKEIFKLHGEFRIRLSSIELNTLNEDVLRVARANSKKFCAHFHLPLQSGSDAVLTHMNRHYTAADYKNKVLEIRSFFPNAGIFADIIAGYPTETEQDFEVGCNLIKECALSGLHVFSFSARPDTKASKLLGLDPKTIKTRAERLRVLDKDLKTAFAQKQVGKTLQLLCEDDGVCISGNFQRVKLKAAEQGKFYEAKITAENLV